MENMYGYEAQEKYISTNKHDIKIINYIPNNNKEVIIKEINNTLFDVFLKYQ